MTIEELNSLKETAKEQTTANFACYFSRRDAEIILELIERTHWIPVGEKPKNHGEYLVFVRDHYTEDSHKESTIVKAIYDSRGWVTEWYGTRASEITHWMPLPEPPEQEVE